MTKKRSVRIVPFVLFLLLLMSAPAFASGIESSGFAGLDLKGTLSFTNASRDMTKLEGTDETFTVMNSVDPRAKRQETKHIDEVITAYDLTRIIFDSEDQGFYEIKVYQLWSDNGTFAYYENKPLRFQGEVFSNMHTNRNFQRPGSYLDLTEKGKYWIEFTNEDASGAITRRNILLSLFTMAPVDAKSVTAMPISSTVLVDGKPVSFDAYNIEGNNYFKLRDLAYAMKDTQKCFNVTYDELQKRANILLKSSYTPVGGELSEGDGIPKTGTNSVARVFVDGSQIGNFSYNINGSSYFKLRDLAQYLDIKVAWNSATSTVEIDTTKRLVD